MTDLIDEALGPIPAWVSRAVCATTDPEAFYPEKGSSTREAKEVCASCEVRAECLAYALDNHERHGIWGGLSERERRILQKTAGKTCGQCGDRYQPWDGDGSTRYCSPGCFAQARKNSKRAHDQRRREAA